MGEWAVNAFGVGPVAQRTRTLIHSVTFKHGLSGIRSGLL